MFRIISRCKITAFFSYVQVLSDEKCRKIAFLLLCGVRILAVVADILAFLVLLHRHRLGIDIAVLEAQVLCELHLDTLLVANDHDIVEEDIVDGFALESLDLDRLLGADTGNVAESDIGPVGEEGILVVVALTPAPLSA